jgi:hypothetical protein
MPNQVRPDDLARLLRANGFEREIVNGGSHHLFTHAKARVELLLPLAIRSPRAMSTYLAAVGRVLDEAGTMSPTDFEAWGRAPRPTAPKRGARKPVSAASR